MKTRAPFTAEELTRLFDQVPAVVWACDRDFCFTFSAGSALTKLGLQPNEVVGESLEAYFSTRPDSERWLQHVRRALAGENTMYEAEWGGVTFESHVAPMRDASGAISGAVGVALDITERRDIEEELLLKRFNLEHANALFPIAHFVIDQDRPIVLDPQHRQILGLPDDMSVITYEQLMALVHPEDRQDVLRLRREAEANKEPCRVEFRVLRPDGSIRHLRAYITLIFDDAGKVARSVGTVTDVTGEVERQREFVSLLQHDGVTGLPNRAYFTERLRHELALASGTSELMALVLLDIDRFSRINDALGHLAGDEYLRTIAARIRSFSQGPQDLAARIGADEFGVVVRGAQRRGELVRNIEKLRTALEEPITINDRPLHVGISAGVALFPYDGRDLTLLQKADLALSRARSVGTGRTEFYDLLLSEDAASSVRLEHDLHFAARNSQLSPFYQPIVGREERLTAVEALVRWKHPAYGILAPATFLELAEESGLIIDIEERVLLAACTEMAPLRLRWPELRLNVNVSSRHLLSRGFIEFMRDLPAKTEFPRHALQIEVTEQSLIADVSAARYTIQSLQALGMTVVIDDFGTGYNTLGYLKSYKVDGLKLDRAFVKDMESDRHSRAICEGVMAMARSLQLPVIAEGIENTRQRDAAIAMGCAEFQGFLFGKPVTAQDIAARQN